jgi:hypothetical protein
MVFFFFGIFRTSLPNQVEHTWLKSQLHICNYEWAKINFVDKGLDSKLKHCGPCKIHRKKIKTSHLKYSNRIDGDFMQNHEKKRKKEKKVKKSENIRFYKQNKLHS